jgi:hypothetical protein
MTDWPKLQSLWEMNWGEPRGTETVRVVEHHVPMLAVCVETQDGATWVPMDIFKRYATPVVHTSEGVVIEPADEPVTLRTWAAHRAEPVSEFKAWRL